MTLNIKSKLSIWGEVNKAKTPTPPTKQALMLGIKLNKDKWVSFNSLIKHIKEKYHTQGTAGDILNDLEEAQE